MFHGDFVSWTQNDCLLLRESVTLLCQVSQAIVEEDDEEANFDRELMELSEQRWVIYYLARGRGVLKMMMLIKIIPQYCAVQETPE